tara:strand:+ start:39 stop:1970 length:1932 start_codon:yes stop_codon:yes gene_type:complete
MQYHQNGFVPGNLQQSELVRSKSLRKKFKPVPEKTDVLIVGCGPAGLTLARQLSVYPEINTCIIESKSGPLLFGQADGVSCRTIEIMEAYNSSEIILKESYWLNQIAYWDGDKKDQDKIKRTKKVNDPRVGLSEFPHVVLNQARIHDLLLDGMKNSSTQLEPIYDCDFVDFKINDKELNDPSKYPITATVLQKKNKKSYKKKISARYIVGCDGAKSRVRKCLNIPLKGEASDSAWGVMDALVQTNFPDIRVKCFIKTRNHGSILVIPREGGYLVRLYIELDELDNKMKISKENIDLDQIIDAAKTIFEPYDFHIKEVPWWSVYEIGQRVASSFDSNIDKNSKNDLPRAFIAGDACHTHSPKAGQGMNVSIHDAFNLGWKLSSVLLKRANHSILNTYNMERRAVAKNLIKLDKDFAKLVTGNEGKNNYSKKNSSRDIKHYFEKQTGFIAGTSIQYPSSFLTKRNSKYQNLAKGFKIGERFHSNKVKRLADGRILHLGHINKADIRWRLFIFCNNSNPFKKQSKLQKLIEFIYESKNSPIIKYTPKNVDIDSIIDVVTVFQHKNEVSIEQMDDFFTPKKGKYQLRDYEKIYTSIPQNDIFKTRAINQREGCIVIVRPDQHIANILSLGSYNTLTSFFKSIMLPII